MSPPLEETTVDDSKNEFLMSVNDSPTNNPAGSEKVKSITTDIVFVVEDDGVTTIESLRPKSEDSSLLGPGPWRFTTCNERSISEQIASLSEKERECFEALKSKWIADFPDKPFSDEMYLRFARCSPGQFKFNESTAWRVMHNFDRHYTTLSAAPLEAQLLTKTLFPIPGLKTKDGHDMFYMRPSRYFPEETSTQAIIDNLVYCMTCMAENEKACTEGIGFLVYINDLQWKNFSVEYVVQFMKTLQGRVPVRVRLFLIVNPPFWFGAIWSIVKNMLTVDMQNKVCMVSELSDMGDFLMDDYQKYLPDDMEVGMASTDDMISDFFKYRLFVDEITRRKKDEQRSLLFLSK